MQQPDPFPNNHNICYFNSLLQCILAAVKKKSILKLQPDHNGKPINLITLNNLNRRLIRKGQPPLRIGIQQCAGEMYTLLMTAYEDFPKFANLFFYEMRNLIVCLDCKFQKTVYERENIITIGNYPDAINSIAPTSETIEYRCSKCQNMKAIKYTLLHKPSPIMVFQVKINNEPNRVKFPQKIKIEDKIWDAVGKIYHFGTNERGHYAACVKLEDKWWIADDERIVEGNLDKCDEALCMIFYKC